VFWVLHEAADLGDGGGPGVGGLCFWWGRKEKRGGGRACENSFLERGVPQRASRYSP
jgi:hypothetical protein